MNSWQLRNNITGISKSQIIYRAGLCLPVTYHELLNNKNLLEPFIWFCCLWAYTTCANHIPTCVLFQRWETVYRNKEQLKINHVIKWKQLFLFSKLRTYLLCFKLVFRMAWLHHIHFARVLFLILTIKKTMHA